MGFKIKTEIMQIADELCSICDCDQMLKEGVKDNLNEDVYPLLNVERPKIMVYGIYNAGKSTLINALYGKEVAEVKDAPMTYKISEYDTGDYFLVDSPGVDAPIEHERVTNDYLKNCHVILYVISTKGGFESKKNYENLYNLIKIGKPFIIVINDKNGEKDLNKSEMIKEIKFKILENLAKVSGESNLESKYDIIAVNGKRGKPGVKQEIYNLSNVGYLKDRIAYFLKNRNAMAMYATPIGNMTRIIDSIMCNIQDSLVSENDNGKNALDRIGYERINIIDQIPSKVKSITSNYYGTLNSALLHESIGNWGSVFESINRELELEFEDIKEKIKYIVNDCGITDLKIDNVDLVLNDFSKDMPTFGDSLSNNKKNDLGHEEFEGLDNNNNNTAMPFLNAASDLNGMIIELIPIIGKIISEKIKREREKEMLEFERLKAEIEMQNNLAIERATIEANKRQEARMHVETTIHNIASQVTKEMTDKISKLFDYIQNNIILYIAKNENELKEKQKFIGKLQKIKRKTESLKNSI